MEEKEEKRAYGVRDGAGTSYRGKAAANGSKKSHQKANFFFFFFPLKGENHHQLQRNCLQFKSVWLCSPSSSSRDLPCHRASPRSVCKRQIANFNERKRTGQFIPVPAAPADSETQQPTLLHSGPQQPVPAGAAHQNPPLQTGECPKKQESAGIKPRQWIGIKSLEMRERKGDAGATAAKGQGQAGVIPKMLTLITKEASTATDTLPFEWLFS